jgi:prepilin-type N-terminal cleavage/methylation domain-containing protein
MPSPPDPSHLQRGFSLFEVMAASVVLSVFILGLGSLYYTASGRTTDLVIRQKAVFVLNAEMERLSSIYAYTSFGVAGPAATDGYDGLLATRLTYPATMVGYMGAGNEFVEANAATFAAGSEFLVWRKSGALPNLDRSYVWIDKDRNVLGRLSWTATNIVVNACWGDDDDCECLGYSGVQGSEDWCRVLELFLEYPYHYASGNVLAPTNLQTITLKTIVGRVK